MLFPLRAFLFVPVRGIALRRCRGQRKAARNFRSGRKAGTRRKRERLFGHRKVE